MHVLRDLLVGLVVGVGAGIGVAIYFAADAAILRLRRRRKTGSPTPRRFFVNQTIAPESSSPAPSLTDVVHAATGAKHLFVRTHCRAPNSMRISPAADALIREELARHVVDGHDRERCLDPAEPMHFQGVPTEVDHALAGAEVACV